MQVLQILQLNERGRSGYLAVLDSYKEGKQLAIKHMGSKYGTSYPLCVDLSPFTVKTCRSVREFDKYVKKFAPARMVNPVSLNGVVFDLPYIHFSNGAYVEWNPHFEESVNKTSFSVLSEGAILEYLYCKPIYLSLLNMKRHVAATNSERLLVNVNTGYTTRELSFVNGNLFCEAVYHSQAGIWMCDKINRTPIAGWKSR